MLIVSISFAEIFVFLPPHIAVGGAVNGFQPVLLPKFNTFYACLSPFCYKFLLFAAFFVLATMKMYCKNPPHRRQMA
jgi:hypothetical protein